MSPGKSKAIEVTDRGVRLAPGFLREIPESVAYGTAVFPLGRELIVLVIAWWLLLRTGGSRRVAVASLVCLVAGLLVLRAGGQDYWAQVRWLHWSLREGSERRSPAVSPGRRWRSRESCDTTVSFIS
ncbi:MAG: hypothetical protein ACE5EX_08730 [Phycisphaerae bacterium]